jgi:uncharacterized protein YtpQ (UPF0354 family)
MHQVITTNNNNGNIWYYYDTNDTYGASGALYIPWIETGLSILEEPPIIDKKVKDNLAELEELFEI